MSIQEDFPIESNDEAFMANSDYRTNTRSQRRKLYTVSEDSASSTAIHYASRQDNVTVRRESKDFTVDDDSRAKKRSQRRRKRPQQDLDSTASSLSLSGGGSDLFEPPSSPAREEEVD
eukprot:2698069-Ditylum_brightwellii.AAC.1